MTSQILTIRQIREGARAKNLQAIIIFVGFNKAFDSIHREKMEQILLAYCLPKENVAAIMMLYRNTRKQLRYCCRCTSIDKIKENDFKLSKEITRSFPAKTITDADYADDIALQANASAQA